MTKTVDFNGRYGPWALVTGASSGMGAEFARQLAGKGMNLVLVARREAALAELKRELEERNGVSVQVLAVDLTHGAALPAIAEATEDLEIGLLVPCAGVETHGNFLGNRIEHEEGMMMVNMVSPLGLAHHFAARMAARGRGGSSLSPRRSAISQSRISPITPPRRLMCWRWARRCISS